MQYQIVSFYLTNQGWIVSDVTNQSGQIILNSSIKIPSDYFVQIRQLTYKPGTSGALGECSYMFNLQKYNHNYNNYVKDKTIIKGLEKKFNRPHVPYI